MRSLWTICLLSLASCGKEANAVEVKLDNGKKIQLLSVSGSQKPQGIFHYYLEKDYKGKIDTKFGLKVSYPVIDQGQHGTCVTFSSTSAVGDKLGITTDYISQQCSLALSKGLGNDIWSGAYTPSEVLDPLKKYGIVSKSSCPVAYGDPLQTLKPEEYAKFVDSSLTTPLSKVGYTYDSTPTVSEVKKALDKGNKVLVGFIVNPYAASGYKVNGKVGGLWACSQWSQDYSYNCGQFNAGHEVLITGYSEKQGLFKIRNSWGTDIGDQGEFYMTYTYFESQVMDSTEIHL